MICKEWNEWHGGRMGRITTTTIRRREREREKKIKIRKHKKEIMERWSQMKPLCVIIGYKPMNEVSVHFIMATSNSNHSGCGYYCSSLVTVLRGAGNTHRVGRGEARVKARAPHPPLTQTQIIPITFVYTTNRQPV